MFQFYSTATLWRVNETLFNVSVLVFTSPPPTSHSLSVLPAAGKSSKKSKSQYKNFQLNGELNSNPQDSTQLASYLDKGGGGISSNPSSLLPPPSPHPLFPF